MAGLLYVWRASANRIAVIAQLRFVVVVYDDDDDSIQEIGGPPDRSRCIVIVNKIVGFQRLRRSVILLDFSGFAAR